MTIDQYLSVQASYISPFRCHDKTNKLFLLIVPISTPKGTDIHPISTPIKPSDFWCDVVTFFIFVTTVRVCSVIFNPYGLEGIYTD
jgi:hypothetical protein